MKLLSPQHVSGDDFEVYVADRYHVAYKDGVVNLLIPVEFGVQFASLYSDDVRDAVSKRQIALAEVMIGKMKDRVAAALNMMGTNATWVN